MINLLIYYYYKSSAIRSTARDVYLPLVAPETPSPDIYLQRVLYLDVCGDTKGHLGLLVKGRGEVGFARARMSASARNGLREAELKRELVGHIERISSRVLPQGLRDGEEGARGRGLADAALDEMGGGAAFERDGDLGDGRGPSSVGERERTGDGCLVAVGWQAWEWGRSARGRGARSRKDEENVRDGRDSVVCRQWSGWSVGTVGTVGTELAIIFVHLPCLFVADPNKYDFGSNASAKNLTNPTREKGELTIAMSNAGASSTFQGRNQVKFIPTAGCAAVTFGTLDRKSVV